MERGKATEEQKSRMPQLYSPGQTGNRRGASSITMLRVHENARKATILREKMLDTLASRIATIEARTVSEYADEPEKIDEMVAMRTMALLTADVNRLITDSESRGFGAPRQTVDIDANVFQQQSRRPEEFSDDELAAIIDAEVDEEPRKKIMLPEMERIAETVLAPVEMPGR